MNTRRIVYFSGRVQGVGFRYTTQRIATGFAVSGYVQNLSDGRVKVVAEGTSEEMVAFLADIQSTMRQNIDDSVSETAAPTGEFNSFSIRH